MDDYQHVLLLLLFIYKEHGHYYAAADEDDNDYLDFEDMNALRYCAGYLLRSVKSKIDSSAHPLKVKLLLCIEDMIEVCLYDSDNVDEQDSEKWFILINRGGLISVDDLTYNFLKAVEIEIRKLFKFNKANNIDSFKDIAFEKIAMNEDVLFYWDMVSVNGECIEANELFKLLVQQYITVRGFSFASAFMEKYKRSAQKSTQKSKGLKKQV
jgi:hypothetical protein